MHTLYPRQIKIQGSDQGTRFGIRIDLAKAIGAKDGSYLTLYLKERSMIGKILRK